jgi:hypothetical protein
VNLSHRKSEKNPPLVFYGSVSLCVKESNSMCVGVWGSLLSAPPVFLCVLVVVVWCALLVLPSSAPLTNPRASALWVASTGGGGLPKAYFLYAYVVLRPNTSSLPKGDYDER